jgi:UDP-N-acetylglucosamine 2-epimerase (non-hydrolysing)
MGTRPEIVKLAPIIGSLPEPPVVIHTGQHYDAAMSGVFFEAFGLAEPKHRLEIGGRSRGEQIGRATADLDRLFDEIQPAVVVAQGDTNSTLAAGLAANARSIPLVHVESGLRSHDRRMPEEHNRIVTDHLADLCLAPTAVSASNLAAEGIPDNRIVITGNTVVDAVNHLLPSAEERKGFLERHDLVPNGFVLSTFHRPENVDQPEALKTIVDQLHRLDRPVLLPLHPRTRSVAQRHGIDMTVGQVRIVEPLGYIEFLGLLAECSLAIADSGGLQEEVSVLKRPMVVVRNSTERPEVLGTFCTLVQVGDDIARVGIEWLEGNPHSHEEIALFPSPYGDGHAASRSVTAIEDLLREAR